ncbi:helix-turn-helix domain-containing protein [Photobacterium leiognathi]|uniref:helix-turn-helix domain-containing protein n=1 Tax=Photobacterium leiognathi TaxID=553611 RepID=UPI0027394471|nr:helix-turn-helix domain-containing protein [Photobacterium leiognathi]
MHHYTESGLDNIYLVNGYEVTEEDGEEYISYTNFDGIQQAIAVAICNQKSWMTPQQLKFIRKEFNLSQSALGLLLYCDRQSIARWEKGETDIPALADITLRALYLESIQEESHVRLTIDSLVDAEIADMQASIHLEEKDGKWKAITAA